MSNTKISRNIYLAFLMLFLTVAAFTGCETTKEINENYLVVSSMAVIPNEEDRGALTLKIEGDYAESAWGIEHIEQETDGNAIILTGTLASEGNGRQCDHSDRDSGIGRKGRVRIRGQDPS